MGIASAVILSIGMLAPYPEIWKRRGRVVGISKYCQARLESNGWLILVRLGFSDFGHIGGSFLVVGIG